MNITLFTPHYHYFDNCFPTLMFHVFMLYKSWVIFDDKIYALKKKKSCQHKATADNARQKSKKYKMISNGNARKRQSRTKKQRKKGQ